MSRPLPLHSALDAHRAALAACRRCTLTPDVRPVVSGARAPRVMLVGQAPGRTEIASGRPFIGRAGRTLFRWLADAGLDESTARAHVYISAITRCFPGPHPAGRGDRVPNPAERARCADWLDAELALIRPALVIPVGRLAIDRFLGPRPLDRLIGAEHPVECAGHASVAVPLPHPSGASSWLNAPANRALLERSVMLLRARFAALELVSAPRESAA